MNIVEMSKDIDADVIISFKVKKQFIKMYSDQQLYYFEIRNGYCVVYDRSPDENNCDDHGDVLGLFVIAHDGKVYDKQRSQYYLVGEIVTIKEVL